MSQHRRRAGCKSSLCQKHSLENICTSCPCCPAEVPGAGCAAEVWHRSWSCGGAGMQGRASDQEQRRKGPRLWRQEGQEGTTSGNPASWMSGQLGWITVMIFSGLKIYYCSFYLTVAKGSCSSRKRVDSSPVWPFTAYSLPPVTSPSAVTHFSAPLR